MSTGAGAIFGNPMNSLNTWSQPSGTPAMGGQNQWMNYPSMPNFGAASGTGGGAGSLVPSASSSPTYPPYYSGTYGTYGGPGSGGPLGGGVYAEGTFGGPFTGQFYSMLSQLMNGLGGSGGLQSQLLSFLSGGQSNIPGANSLTSMANTGDPISALPEWQSMIQAQQRNIGENAANLKEQFAFAGDLQSSPFGTAASDYFQQTSKDQNALLAQLEQQAMESAMQRELSASTSLTGMAGAESQFLDSLFAGSATASPNLYSKNRSSQLGGIGSLLAGGAQGLSTLEDAGLSLGFLGL